LATNTLLTPTQITRKMLDVLHQKLNFVGNVNRQYDSQFAQDGAKIGTSLNIRMPAKYTVRTGATLSAQDYTERSTPLTVSSQYGVDVSFTSVELTMSLDDYTQRVIEPAMAQLAAKIEGDCFSAAYKLVNNYTNATTDGLITYKRFQQGGANITRQLGPMSQRCAILSPDSQVEFNDAVKGLFQASENIRQQYREGMMGRTGGFDVYENTLLPSHTTGTLDSAAALTDGASLGTGTTTQNTWVSQTDLEVDGVTADTLLAGDIITISGVYEVHPETKVNTGRLKTFVVQSDVTLTTAANNYTVTVKPGLIYGSGNAYQNCALSGTTDTDNHTVTLIGAVGSAFGQDLQFHKDAFVFATADLIDVSNYGAWGSRAQKDGISLRLARQYDINNDAFPARVDVLFGFAGLYPELANRHMYELDLL
jgi:hypothetical protein